jgi:DNA-binding NarL/FixJ family response regulator
MIEILLVDDHAIVREGLRRIIDDTTGITISAEASTGQDALNLIWKEKYDLVILDISMPGKNGLQTLKEIKKHDAKLPVLMLSMHAEKQYAMRAIKAGASGYLTKESASEQLVSAIRKIFDGRKYISPGVAELLVTDIYHDEDKELHEYLSDREFEIFKLIVRGDSAKIIAENLSISDKTVSTYRSRILKKMNMKNTADIIHYAIENNISD